MMFVSFSSITTGVTSGAETANPCGGHPRFLVGFPDFRLGVMIMVFNATLNNISVISLWSVLLVEETRVLGENYRPVSSCCQN